MRNIKIINTKNANDFFEIPWDWVKKGCLGPNLNDLEASAERGKLTGKLNRVRCAEIPSATLDIIGTHSQKEIYPLLKLLRNVEIDIFYFEKYLNQFVTRRFYAKKPNPAWSEIPENDLTDNIKYEPFSIEFVGYEDINT